MKLQRRWLRRNKTKTLLFIVLLWCLSCSNNKKQHEVQPAFYYWKTIFQLSSQEKKILKDNQVKIIYLKFFDVDWDRLVKKPVAKALIIKKMPVPNGIRIIPVVYITNKTLEELNKEQVVRLAERIATKVKQLEGELFSMGLTELQIDCDWTKTTRSKYFLLLANLRTKTTLLSATIRLHQIKYSQITGVPPVDRGMLMSYNMSNWQQLSTLNSIYEPATLSKYIASLESYPLPLDLVMPLFHWAIVYRNNRFLYFINQLEERYLLTQKMPISLFKEHQYLLTEDRKALGIAFRKGDIIKIEEVPFTNLLKGSALLCKKISNQKLTFAFYHLDESILSIYSYEQISQLFQNVK